MRIISLFNRFSRPFFFLSSVTWNTDFKRKYAFPCATMMLFSFSSCGCFDSCSFRPFLIYHMGILVLTRSVFLYAGLYFKLHGTHRPNSMKKSVIKRRKRVAAAPAAAASHNSAGGPASHPQRSMVEEGAAQVLLDMGVPRVVDDSEDEAEQPKRKRARRGKASATEKRAEDEDAVMETAEESEREMASSAAVRKRRSPLGARAHYTGSSSPQHRSGSMPRMVESGMVDPRYAHLQRTVAGPFIGSPSHHVAYDLPLPFAGSRAEFMPPSSYIRSGSNAPSRTHSPLGPGGYGTTINPFYAGVNPEVLMAMSLGTTSSNGAPTVAELERHYMELAEHKKRYEEMASKTERLMVGIKRGLEEMRGVSTPSGRTSPSAQAAAPPARSPQPAPATSPSPLQQSIGA